jgi:hypothetical protein
MLSGRLHESSAAEKVFQPLFTRAPPEPAIAPPAPPPMVALDEVERRLIAAERAGYEKGLSEGLLENASAEVGRLRKNFVEVSSSIQDALVRFEADRRRNDDRIDQALRDLAACFAAPAHRPLMHELLARYVAELARDARAAEGLELALSDAARTFIEKDLPEVSTALRSRGFRIATTGSDAVRAEISGADGCRIEVDFEALIADLRTALSQKSSVSGDAHGA